MAPQSMAESSAATVFMDKTPYRQMSAPKPVTNYAFNAFRKGRTINIFVGAGNDRRVAVGGAFPGLLKHYSGLAKQVLSEDVHNITVPGASKQAVAWSYKFMLSREKDSTFLDPKFDSLGLQNLALLHSTCILLQYDFLENKSFNRLKYLIGTEGFRDYKSFKSVHDFVPDLRDAIIKAAAKDTITEHRPSYLTEICEIPGVSEAIDSLVNEYETKKKAAAQPASQRTVPKAKNNSDIACYACKQTGHIARNCSSKLKAISEKSSTRIVSQIDFKGATKAIVKQPFRVAPTCYQCHQVGHVARNCSSRHSSDSRCSSANFTHRNGQAKQSRGNGRNKFLRRDQVIKVAGNGEGITTCEYEVQEGQFTRLGLKI